MTPGNSADVKIVSVGERSGLRYALIRAEWAERLQEIEYSSFPTADREDLCDAPFYVEVAALFPEGCFVGLSDDGDEPVAIGFGVRVNFDLSDPQHTFHDLEALADNNIGHIPDGEWYYGIDIAVLPDYRRRGIGQELYELRKQVCRDLNLRGIIAGGVLPGYADHKAAMSPDDYVSAVRNGELYDPTLTFQLENGFEAPCALINHMRDPEVDNAASLLVWHNTEFSEADSASEGDA